MTVIPRQSDRIALQISRGRRRIVELDDIYFLEAEGERTWVRTRSARRLRDGRPLGDILARLEGSSIVRLHRNHAVNLRHVMELRTRPKSHDWEVRLAPPVNRLLPVSRSVLADLRKALGDG